MECKIITGRIQLDFPAQRETAVSLADGDVDESENKYARRKPVGFIGKLMKAHEIHPKYKVNFKRKNELDYWPFTDQRQ